MQSRVPAPRCGELGPVGTPLRVATLRAGYLAGTLTPADVVDTVLARLEATAGDHAWISTFPAAVLRARAVELAAAGDRTLPLYGIPFAVKDNIDVAGLPTTAACPAFAYRPDGDAAAVRRLLDAGAICVGKTNLDQFATGLTGARSPYGAPASVYGGGLVSGGSSSGSAVAVANGTVAFSLGTDTAGSGRVPAALNGIVGLKPTRGALSTAGVVPACRSLDCVSVFTHDVADAAEVFEVALAPGGRAVAADPGTPPALLRLGVPASLEFFGDGGSEAAFAAAVARARRLVGVVEPVGLEPFLEAGELLYQGPWVAERLADLEGFLASHGDDVLPVTRSIIAGGARWSAVDLFRAEHRLASLRAVVDPVWSRVDALVLPTIGTTVTADEVAADPIGRNTLLGRYTQFANLLDLAVVTVPNGMAADGRPASLSVVGPAGSDRLLARIAAALAEPSLSPPAGLRAAAGVAGVPPAAATPAATTAAAPPPARAAGRAVDLGGRTLLAVAGRHLQGESHNHELLERGGVYAETTTTASEYRLYRVPVGDGDVPALVRVPPGQAGVAVEVELWALPTVELGGLLTGVPAPLTLGRVRLAGGRLVLGFLGEAAATTGAAEDISATGGWRAYRRALTP